MNHAALDPDDVADARRGHPAVDLAGYAAARGLTWRGQGLTPVFAGLNPRFPDYTFNVAQGEFPGQRFGVVQHDLIEIRLHQGGGHQFSGGLYGVRAVTNWGLAALVHLDQQDEERPFADHYLYVPTTTVMVQAPETVFLPRLVIRPVGYLPLRPRRLGPAADGFGVDRADHLDEAQRHTLGAALGPILAGLGHRYVELALSYGRLRLRVNGFVGDPAVLDHLVTSASALADALTELCRGWHVPVTDLQHPLPAFDATTHPTGWPSAMWMGRFDDSLLGSLRTIADNLSMRIEDPVALHRAHPSLPLPGASIGVVAGQLPGSSTVGRLTWQFPGHWRGASYRWGAAVLPASPTAPPTPPGGAWWEPTKMWVAVRGGLACCWTSELFPGHFHSRQVAERAVETARATGIAAV